MEIFRSNYVTKLLAVFFLLMSGKAAASVQIGEGEYEWVLKRERDGISVYTSKVTDSEYRAVSSSMIIDARVASLVALVTDLENCPNWAAMCEEARMIKSVSATESFIYTLNDVPFPARDRDILAHVEWSLDKSNGQVSMLSKATQGQMPPTKGVVRVESAETRWEFTPLKGGKVLVESFVHVDPNGPIPAWIVNQLLVGSPYKTMKKMRSIINEGGYADAELPF